MFKRFLTLIMVFAMVLTFTGGAIAQTANPGPTLTGYETLFIPINNITAAGTVTATARFKAPWPYQVVAVSTSARASSGTTPTLTLDLKSGSTSVFTTPCSVTAGAVTTCTLSTTVANRTLGDEATITVDAVAGGTTPTFSDITLMVAVKRL